MRKRMIKGIIAFAIMLSTIGVASYCAVLYPISDWNLGDTYTVSYGSSSNVKYTVNELLQLYMNNSPGYKSIDLSFSINELQCEKDELVLQSCNENIQTYNDLIVQYQNLADLYQAQVDAALPGSDEQIQAQANLESCLLSIQTYQSQLIAAAKQKAEAYTQFESDSFIKENAPLIKSQEQFKQQAACKESCVYLITMEEQSTLLENTANYASMVYSIERTNLSNGRSTQIDVDYADAEYQFQLSQKEALNDNYKNSFKSLLREAGVNDSQDTRIEIDIKSMRPHTIIDYDIVEDSFIANDIKEKQLAENISIIDGKIDILNDYLPSDSVDISLELKQKELAILEHDKWLLERKAQLQIAYSTYEKEFDQVDIKEKAAEAQYQKYHVVLNKYNLGLISKIELQKTLLAYSQSKLDAWKAFYEYVCAFNVIERIIRGSI